MDKFGRFTGVRSLFAVPVVLAMLLAGMALAACGGGGDTEPTARPTAAESGGATREPSDEATREPATTASQAEADEGGDAAEPTRQGVLGRTGSQATTEPESTEDAEEASQPKTKYISVSAGGAHTCALEVDRTVVCGGLNELGQATPPVGEFATVIASWHHTCGLTPIHRRGECGGGLKG